MRTQTIIGVGLIALGLLGIVWYLARKPDMDKLPSPKQAAKADAALCEAGRLMSKREYQNARDQYNVALNDGADAVACLAGVAECSYYLQDDITALAVCQQLACLPGGAGRAHLIRGLVIKRHGEKAAALAEFQQARCLGEVLAVPQIAALGGQ